MRTRSWAVGSMLVMAICIAANAAPPEGPKPGSQTFVPSGGYLRTTKLLQLRRRAAFADLNLAAAARARLQGSRQIPVILLEYKNVAAPFASANYQELLFDDSAAPNPQRLTLTQYYRDISNENLLVTGQVFGWYKLPNDDSFYENGDNGAGANFGAMLEFGLKQADAETDFGRFDNDGPDGQPNSGDDDGKVDTVFFIHPEVGAEAGNRCHDAEKNIWSHSWHYSEPSYGHHGPFVTNDVRLDAQARPVLNSDGTPQQIVIEDYTIQPALDCASGEKRIVPIGVFCHEFGHALGLPDLYDRTPRGNPDSEGVGNWCVMAGGSYGGDGVDAARPTHMSPWCKAQLGWAQIQFLDTSRKVVLEPVEARNTIYRIDIPGGDGKEYFLVEYRAKNWKDPFGERVNWDSKIPAAGLAIWHCDDNVGAKLASGLDNPVWPFAGLDQGQNDSCSMPHASSHAMVRILQADRKMDLERNHNRGDAGDLFVVNGLEDDDKLICGTRGYAGTPTGIKLAAINIGNDNADAMLDLPTGTPTAAGVDPTVVVLDTAPPGGAGTTQPTDAVTARDTAPPGRPSVQPAVARADADLAVTRNVKDAAAKINTGRAIELTKEQTTTIENSSVQELQQSLPAEQQSAVKQFRARKLTTMISADPASAKTPAEVKVSDLVRQSAATTQPARINYGEGKKYVESVTGLNLPKVKDSDTVQEDAQARMQQDFTELCGPHVRLRPVKQTGRSPASTQPINEARFEQFISVGDTKLPVFETEAVLHYKDDHLQAMQANVVQPSEIQLGSTQPAIDETQAGKIVTQTLGISSEKFTTKPTLGVYIDPTKPDDQGHLAYHYEIQAGEVQEPINVYIDANTQKFLSVK